jgi:tetratricopeptide (TPR) repeat protein
MPACLGDATIGAYVDGAMSVAEIEGVERHIDTCGACRAQLSAVAASAMMRSYVDAPGTAPTVVADAARAAHDGGDVGANELIAGAPLGRYVVESILGRGGMGVVVAAYDPELDRRVAIKLVDPSSPDGRRAPGTWRARLRAEARAMARLRHPNVIAVYDAGSVGEQLFVAMELVDGEHLARWLDRHGRHDALAACIAAGRGLCAAHAAGLVHGDVKPENILVGADGRAMIGDFGLARALGARDLGGGHAVGGTPPYMAPELFRGEPADPRSDQLAFAVTVFESLAGVRPWRGDSVAALRTAIEGGPPPRPPEIPAWVWPVIARGLAADPDARHPSVAALVDGLERVGRRRRRWWLAGAGAVGVLGAGLVAVSLAAAHPPGPGCGPPDARTGALAAATRRLCGPSSGPGCAALAAGLERRLDSWRATHVEVCQATRSGRQSSALLDARMRCLDRTLTAQEALLARLVPAPLAATDVLDATAAVAHLDPPARCATIDRADGAPTPPAGRAAAVAEAERWIAAAHADHALGRYRAGLDTLAPHQAAIDALAYPPTTATASRILGTLQLEVGDLAAAEASFERGLQAAAAAGDDVTAATLLLRLADLVGETREQPERGAELLRAASAAVVRAGNPPELESTYLLQRGGFAENRGELEAAAADFERAYQLRRASGGDGDPETAVALQRLCGIESQLGKLEQARDHCMQALALLRDALGADHPVAARAQSEVGVAFAILGDLDTAVEHWQGALASLERSLGPRSPGLVPVLMNLGQAAAMRGDAEAAARHLAREIELAGADPDDPNNLALRIQVARQLAFTDPAAAADMLDDVVHRSEAQLGAAHPTTASALAELAAASYQADRLDAAEAAFARAGPAHAAIYGERHAVTLTLAGRYGQTLMARGRAADARPVFERAMLALEATVPADSPFLAAAQANLADCLLELGEPVPAADLAARAVATREALGDDPLQLAEARFTLGQSLWRAGRERRRAVELVRTARDEMRRVGPAALSLPRVERWLAGTR